MAKYKRKPTIVDAVEYKEGMEDGWQVNYSCQGHCYDRVYATKELALTFIKQNRGALYLDFTDVKYDEPIPYIVGRSDKCIVHKGDYVLTFANGKREVKDTDSFYSEYDIL